VLFDEIEKAHPDVWNTLLQVLEDGRLTDGQGRTVDFKNTVIVMTSNVGSRFTLELEDDADIKRAVMNELRSTFRPELLNRLDEIVVFHKLGTGELRRVVDLQMARFAARLKAREIGLEISDAAKDWLGEIGFDPTFGARPMKRAIQKHLENPIAEQLLGGQYAPGDVIRVDLTGGSLAIAKKQGELRVEA
jgi:ATP-dependent Clp protease ATP-binding subunit ClpB